MFLKSGRCPIQASCREGNRTGRQELSEQLFLWLREQILSAKTRRGLQYALHDLDKARSLGRRTGRARLAGVEEAESRLVFRRKRSSKSC